MGLDESRMHMAEIPKKLVSDGKLHGGVGGCLCGMGKWCDICRPKGKANAVSSDESKGWKPPDGSVGRFTLENIREWAAYMDSPEYAAKCAKEEAELAAFFAPGGPFEQNGYKYPMLDASASQDQDEYDEFDFKVDSGPLVGAISDFIDYKIAQAIFGKDPDFFRMHIESNPSDPNWIQKLRDAGGDGWDKVDDVDAELDAIRGREPDRIPVGKLDDGSTVYMGERLDFPKDDLDPSYIRGDGEIWIATIGAVQQIKIVDGVAKVFGFRAGLDGMVRWGAKPEQANKRNDPGLHESHWMNQEDGE